ncbi:COR domain-containing protein [Leucothrix arctica]|nr:COR domain-containing protein [Leucothrix arctica]
MDCLQVFSCTDTQVSDLSPLRKTISLETLRCGKTSVIDLSPVNKLSKLSEVKFQNTNIRDLLPLSQLKNLSVIECSSTLVSTLEPIKEQIQKNSLDISLKDCPLISPPIEFAESGNKAINEYFDQIGIDSEPLNQTKVIFLGDGGSGKTSLIKRLRNEVFDESEGQTHGIQIHSVDFNTGFDSISARLWDFGGQEVMHATHQFFLSQRCIYVLLLNSRTDEKAEYWLKHANSFGGNSPVLVVLNKIDENPSFEVDRKRLSSKYKQIKGFHRVSCKTDEGLGELQEALREQFLLSDTRRTPFPTTWSAVKNHFLNMQDTFIESSEFRKVCQALGVDKKFSQDVLLQFLHDLGIVINFKKLKQFDTQILDPVWLTNGVYRIINSPLITENKGLLQESEFDDVISKSELSTNPDGTKYQYPPSKQLYIVRVMQEFELCFPLNHEQYIVPQLLPVQEADFEFEGATLHFIVNFPDFLPDSIFIRLMVKLHDYIKDDLRWRSGMILSKPLVFDAVARVRADKEDRKIEIDVCGKEPRRFLKFIRVTLQEIIDDFPQLNYEEMVPLPKTDELVPYLRLVGMEEAGVEHHFVLDTKENIKVSSLLDGIEDSEMRSEVNQTIVKAFISYSHEDKEHLKELRKALSPLERLNKLEIWDDRSIDGGDDWESEIFQKLRDSDIVLCLVSASFVKSDFCHERELEQALKDHQSGKQIVVPIQLRECNWDSLPIAKLQGLPGDWIQNSDNTDRALTLVSKELEEIIHKIQEKRVRAKHGIGNPSHSGREEGGQ